MALGKLSVPVRPTNLVNSRARPTVLAEEGASGVVWTFFSRLSFLSSFYLPLGDGPI